jgi:hypothetical protein
MHKGNELRLSAFSYGFRLELIGSSALPSRIALHL